jgi:HEAT repeat protein
MPVVNISRAYERIQKKIKGLACPVPENRKEPVGRELLNYLQDHLHEDAETSRDIIYILGDVQYAPSIPFLLQTAQVNSLDGTVKRACVNALCSFQFHDSVQAFLQLLGVHLSAQDKWVRQLAAHHLTTHIRRLKRDQPKEADRYFSDLCVKYLTSENTYTRMNTAIVLRLLGNKQAVPHLEQRLKKEQAIAEAQPSNKGIPFIVREIEKALQALKD